MVNNEHTIAQINMYIIYLYLNLPRTYTAYLEPIRFTLDNIEFILDNMTPVFLVQLFELHADLNVKGFINIFYFFSELIRIS